MPFQPVPNVARVAVEQSLAGEQVVNVLHFSREGGFDVQSLQQLAIAVFGAYGNLIYPFLSVDIAMLRAVATSLSQEGGPQATTPAGPPVPGGNGSASLPGGSAFCITHRTSGIGRSRRGRTYLAGIAEGQVLVNTLATPVVTNLVLGFNTMRANLAAQGFFFGVISRKQNGVVLPVAQSYLITGSEARDPFIDSQRRRNQGR